MTKTLGKTLGGIPPPEFFPKFLTLPQIIPTSLAKQKGNILYKNCTIGAVLVRVRFATYYNLRNSVKLASQFANAAPPPIAEAGAHPES